MTSEENAFLVKAIEYMKFAGRSDTAIEGVKELYTINPSEGREYFVKMFPQFKYKDDDEVFETIDALVEGRIKPEQVRIQIGVDELEKKRHSFEVAKQRIKDFSEEKSADLNLAKVETAGGFLGLGEHTVTGSEFNRRIEAIQELFITLNKKSIRIIQEFREIYTAFDALDKDYISSIVANVKSIEKTSNDVRRQQETLKQHNEKLATQQSKLDVHQAEIEKNVTNISKIVATLKCFKEKLDGYKHLTDIDEIWTDCKSIQKDNKALSEQVNTDLNNLRKEVDSFRILYSEITEKLENIQKNIRGVDSVDAENVQITNSAIESLAKKVKYAFWIAGGAAGVAIIELIILLMKVF